MVATKLFMACAISLILANVVYYSTQLTPNTFINNMFSGLISTVASAIVVIGILSLNALTVSISDSFITMIITTTLLVNLFFRITIANFSLGFGLLTNIMDLTATGTFFGIGNILMTVFGLIMFISAMMMISGSGE